MNLEILQRDKLKLGGFAGLTEHQLIIDQRIGGDEQTWNGMGNFVYLADARFQPKGETKMHSHSEIDVISVMVEGKIEHEGSLKHGQSLQANQVQVQRAGGEGFSHNEINPENKKNRMIQLWVLPEIQGEPASYKLYNLKQDQLTHIYGGSKDQNKTLESHTIINIGLLSAQQEIIKEGNFLLYMIQGSANLNNKKIQEGDLIRGENLNFQALKQSLLMIVTVE